MASAWPDRMSGGEEFAYVRHKPEQTLFYQLIERDWPAFQSHLSEAGGFLPRHVVREFDEYLDCGRLEHVFFVCVAATATTSIWWPSAASAEVFVPAAGQGTWWKLLHFLVDDVLPHKPIRQWVLSFLYPLRFLLANSPQVVSSLLSIVNRVISTHLIKKAGFNKTQAHTGAVTLIQRFGSVLNLNVHFHMLFIDGAYQEKPYERVKFHPVNAPTARDLNALVATISQRVARCLERQGL
jgi:hypothetical protein